MLDFGLSKDSILQAWPFLIQIHTSLICEDVFDVFTNVFLQKGKIVVSKEREIMLHRCEIGEDSLKN